MNPGADESRNMKTYRITGADAIRIAERDGCTSVNGAINVTPSGWYCGTGDVRPLSDGFDVDDYFRGGRYLGPDVNGVEPTWADVGAEVRVFDYATDGESGEVEASTLEEAYQTIRAEITEAQVKDGATLWVEDPKTGERLTMGVDGECKR